MNDRELKRIQEESYQHIKPYIHKQEDLKEMCLNCECYCGEKHDYDECRNRQCFKFYLTHEYFVWAYSWRNGGY